MPTNKRLKVDNRQKTLTQTGFLSKGNIEEPTKKGDDAHTTETKQPTNTETNENKKIVNLTQVGCSCIAGWRSMGTVSICIVHYALTEKR